MDIDFTLYLATDRKIVADRDLCDAVDEAIGNGVTIVQLRDKHCSDHELYETGRALRVIAKRHGVPLLVNDRVDIMLALDADGVHIGPDDLPLDRVRHLARGKIVGCSVNSLDDLQRAESGGADYAGVGPVFATATKQDARDVLGLEGLARIVNRAALPCVAIGGITPDNADEVMGAGVRGVCAISAVLGARDIGAAVRQFRANIEKSRRLAKP